ncbi:MAG: stress responsive protein [Planctomycetales bacterium 71-10]|nr:MAG: stress responsive protein [Planctomycetales bacterium 71-10]
MLAHSVFFSLHDPSAASIDALVGACRKYLDGHPGVAFFGVGTLNRELDRPVNDRAFDVALHVVFDSKASHDAYQVAPRHLQFIEENKPNWKQVRVFDADL